jgi:hypothetical protein
MSVPVTVWVRCSAGPDGGPECPPASSHRAPGGAAVHGACKGTFPPGVANNRQIEPAEEASKQVENATGERTINRPAEVAGGGGLARLPAGDTSARHRLSSTYRPGAERKCAPGPARDVHGSLAARDDLLSQLRHGVDVTGHVRPTQTPDSKLTLQRWLVQAVRVDDDVDLDNLTPRDCKRHH